MISTILGGVFSGDAVFLRAFAVAAQPGSAYAARPRPICFKKSRLVVFIGIRWCEHITYTITVKNNGPDDAHGVEVTDILPEGLTYIGHSASGSTTYDLSIWNVGNLPNGATETLEITVQVNVDDVNNATFNLGLAADYNLFVLYDAAQPSSDPTRWRGTLRRA